MTALSASRNTPQRGTQAVSDVIELPVADNVKGYAGGIAVLSAGYVKPAVAGLGLVAVGRFEADFDNTVVGHAAGAFNVRVRTGVFLFANATDAIAQADVGNLCYLVDDQTVGKTDANGTLSPAGTVMEYTAGGIYVALGPQASHSSGAVAGYPKFVVTVPIPAMAGIANSDVVAKITNQTGGPLRVKAVDFVVATAISTGAKTATLTTNLDGSPVTGAVVTPAGVLAKGAIVNGTAVTAANVLAATKDLTIVASAVTTFIEGAGELVITFA